MSPSAPATVFEETQWFFRRWWWLLLGSTLLLLAPLVWAAFTEPDGVKAVLITSPLFGLLLFGLWYMKLTVRVDAAGIHYHYPPMLNRWRHWSWTEFKRVAPRTYAPFSDYGGWGIRGWPGNLAYNVWGRQGLQLVFQSGDRLLLGTQRPNELRAVLETLHAADACRPIQLATATAG